MMPTSTDNPALDEHGNLKDASDMKWYHSEDNEQPLLMPKERVATASGLSSKGGSPILSNSFVNYSVQLHSESKSPESSCSASGDDHGPP